ncbi:hypothetical protein D3C73_16990 [compost metagenome]
MATKRVAPVRSTKKASTKKIHAKQVHISFWHKVRVLSLIAIVTVLVFSNFGIGTLLERDIVVAAGCRAPDTKVYTQYPVSGYFMYTGTDQCQVRTSLESMHKIGADTAITFGSSLKPISPSDLRNDALYRYFGQGGRHGYDIAWSATGGGRIANVFTYSDKITLASKAHICGNRDGKMVTANGTFDWFLVPTDAGYSDCTSPSKTYDLVVSSSKSGKDANTTLIKEAELYGMKVYLGLPKTLDHQTGYSHTFGSFTTRVLKSWQQLYGGSNAFAGVYQTQEVRLGKGLTQNGLKLYDIQHKIVTYQLAKNKQNVLVSPWTSLYRSEGNTLADITASTKLVASTANGVNMIMSPQDGAGTGRVGLYDTYETNYRVRTAVTNATGSTASNNNLYAGDTRQFIQAVKNAGLTTWVNVEAFKPGGVVGARPLSDRATLDKQVRRVGPVASKIIGYRWNDYMTKVNPATNASLYRSIYVHGDKPVLASASRINGGVRLVGYKFNTKGSSTIIVNSNGTVRRLTVQPSAFGTHLSGRMQTLNLAVGGLQSGKPVYVQVINNTQRTNTLGFTY